MSNVLLEVKDLKKYYKVPKGMLHAVDGVSFDLEKGKTLGIVGESGCGKTTIGRAILRLVEPTSGSVIFDGVDIPKLNKQEMRYMRRNMQLIFQDPFSSLNPRKTITQTIEEPIILANMIPDPDKRFMRVMELMDTVGLAERLVNTYPHELDGGRRQRVRSSNLDDLQASPRPRRRRPQGRARKPRRLRRHGHPHEDRR